MDDLQQTVARSGDAADLHATVPTLLLELQSMLGSLAATVTSGSDRGRRPYRPGDDFGQRLGEVAYGVYLLADQAGVDVEQVVRATAARLDQQAAQLRAQSDNGWPFNEQA